MTSPKTSQSRELRSHRRQRPVAPKVVDVCATLIENRPQRRQD